MDDNVGADRTRADGASPLDGDVGLLVPLESTWRVLDLTSAARARCEVLSPWVQEAVAVVTRGDFSPTCSPEKPHCVERAGAAADDLLRVVADPCLPFRNASFDLVVLEEAGPWPLERVRPLLRPGGYVIWLLGGLAPPSSTGSGLGSRLHAAGSWVAWAVERGLVMHRWRQRLKDNLLELTGAYVHFQDYSRGYLPFDAGHVQRYYLESLQEEGVGTARGRALIARWLGRLGVYRYLVSSYVVVARAQGSRRR